MPNTRRRLIAFATISLLALAVAGCESTRVTGSVHPDTYRERHPIVVGESLATLDLLPGAGQGGLSNRQEQDIAGFAREWRQNGRGMVIIQVPQGGSNDAASSQSVRAIRSVLMRNGVPARTITHGAYTARGPGHLAPVRLAYPRVSARTAQPCGQWPTDTGYGSDVLGSMSNKDYWNFGCATQHNLAMQVADPEDIIRPRAEDPSYAPRRADVLTKYRQGQGTASEAANAEPASTTESRSE
jgi:pilus assembly protein CpaD